MDKETLQSLTQRLAAIEMPPPPNWQPYIIGAVVITITIALCVSILLLRRKHSPQPQSINISQAALGRLDQLHDSWQTGKLNDQHTAYQLAAILRLGLKLKQLTTQPPANLNKDKINWQHTVQLLQTLRYAKQKNTKLNNQTFEQVRLWLHHGATPC